MTIHNFEEVLEYYRKTGKECIIAVKRDSERIKGKITFIYKDNIEVTGEILIVNILISNISFIARFETKIKEEAV